MNNIFHWLKNMVLENRGNKQKTKKRKLLRSKRKNESWFKYIMSVLHLWLGLLSALIVIAVSLSGAIYAYKHQVSDLFNRKLLRVEKAGAIRQPVDSLLTHFNKNYGEATSVEIHHDERRTVLVSSRGREAAGISLYYDPYTARPVGVKNNKPDAFFAFMLEFHRYLLLGEVGKQINGAAVLIFLFMLISGFILWLPKKLKYWRNAFLIKWKAKFYRINYDLHNVLGFYSLLLLFFIGVTGLYVSYQWMKNVIIVGLGGEQVVTTEASESVKKELAASFSKMLGTLEKEKQSDTLQQKITVAQMLTKADSIYPFKGILQIQLPNAQSATYEFTKMNHNHFAGFTVPEKITFASTGSIREVKAYSNLELHDQFRAIAKPLHTGEIMGLWSIIVYSVVSLIACSLPITGFIIWWKKRG